MRKKLQFLPWVPLWMLAFFTLPAHAETIELVTYYPSTATAGQMDTDRLHANRATVGNPYSLTVPADANFPNGTLLVADQLGIGPGFVVTPPAGALHVVGAANQPDRVLFMPGAGGTLNVGIGTASPDTSFTILGDTGVAYQSHVRLTSGTAQTGYSLFSTHAAFSNPFTAQTGDGFNSGDAIHPDFYGGMFPWMASDGGLIMIGVSDASGVPAFGMEANQGVTGTTRAPFWLNAVTDDGAGRAASIPASDNLLQIANRGTVRMTVLGRGNVGIGTASPSAAAMLQVDSVTGGLLPPRMTTAQRDAIAAPPAGLMLFNTENARLEVFNGSQWVGVGSADIDYFSVTKTDYFLDWGRTTWVDVPGLSIGGIQLLAGDIVRLTVTGSILQGSNPVGGYGRLRYTFSGVSYGPHINLGTVPASSVQTTDSFCVVLLCGAGAGDVPPGTYTVRLQNLPSQDGPSGTHFNYAPMEPDGSSVVMTVERIRS